MTGWIAGWATALLLTGAVAALAGSTVEGTVLVVGGSVIAALGRRP